MTGNTKVLCKSLPGIGVKSIHKIIGLWIGGVAQSCGALTGLFVESWPSLFYPYICMLAGGLAQIKHLTKQSSCPS